MKENKGHKNILNDPFFSKDHESKEKHPASGSYYCSMSRIIQWRKTNQTTAKDVAAPRNEQGSEAQETPQ